MTQITATDTFDTELLDDDTVDELEPFLEWLNTNMQNIVAALQGGISDENTSTLTVSVNLDSGVRKFFKVEGQV